jgi:DMSO/TMAO reductase YedYZ molybdopterin-dependent catalytic subunit
LVVAILLTVTLTFYLRGALRGPTTVHVGGAVEAAYDYPTEHSDLGAIAAEGTLREVTANYEGVPIRELLARAQPLPGASLLLVRASDGYAFFISLDEVENNDALLLAPQGEEEVSYNIVGAQNSKAWIRGVTELSVVGASALEVGGALDKAGPYVPGDWQFEMDATRIDLGDGPRKLQGVPLGMVLATMEPQESATTVLVHTHDEPLSLPLAEVLADDSLRLFTVIGQENVTTALARMEGEILTPEVLRIEVQ